MSEAKGLEVADVNTGELIPFEQDSGDLYHGISAEAVSDEATAILSAPVQADDIEVRPDGQIYYPEMKYRVLLNKAFGIAGWGIRPFNEPMIREGLAMQTWGLYVGGRFVSQATGECELVKNNQQMTYGDILEGTKSVAIRRLCKDLGVASELWDRSFIYEYLKTHCFKVWVDGKERPQWRKMTSPSFYKESGIADDSPNKDQYLPGSIVKNKPTKSKPIPQKAIDRPLSPERLRELIGAKAELHAKNNVQVSKEQRGLIVGVTEQIWDGEDKKTREKNRHSLYFYLTGRESSKDATGAEMLAIKDWLKWTQDEGGLYIIDEYAIQEANLIINQVLKEAGQQELPKEA
jgi:hypothetical protein